MKPIQPAVILLRRHLKELALEWLEEYRFHETRLWRLDFYLPDYRIGIEVDGAVYTAGRHTRGKGFEDDCVKANHATMAGIRMLRFSTGQVLRGEARAFLAEQMPTESDNRSFMPPKPGIRPRRRQSL